MPKIHSQETRAVLREGAGKVPDVKVAKLAGCCVRTVASYRKEHGIPAARSPYYAGRDFMAKHDPDGHPSALRIGENRLRIRALIREGHSASAIAAEVGVSKARVYDVAKRDGLTFGLTTSK